MPPKYAELETKLDKIHDDVLEVKQALKGYNGQIGLCKQVERNSKQITRIWITITALAVSIGGGIWGVIEIALKGM